ncbi:protein phosphatase 1 catalitic subunit,putative [Leishmania mexicana MHOM/GT/2001/U1103]|uniref:Serine/threonine-protein phosphatase n=1 Tax=Leishmania mexicana (strain MHOM/GT/2001/U1103) TaxID=929439 RepID=E9AQ21_LEIMU|nr:protein phosphatase 1 catalitic subunit,putative [Leishmania mexicana MHOM/GT/2001/U1103]CBZ25039.1 protein phosphatase 1 catalitic subunit,putative [Leishmania mexicana MHOM/GT/2001/U1103]
MAHTKRGRFTVDLSMCTLSSLPTDTLSVEKENDVLYRLLELLPERYTSKVLEEQRIPEGLIVQILIKARAIIASEPILVEVDSPVYACGDLHGQYYDLVNIFKRCPPLGGTVFGTDAKKARKESSSAVDDKTYSFLFLGDYVDRGARSVEVVVTLLALKIISPRHMTMLRGNHEDEQIMLLYGFYDECKRRYGIKLFKTFTDFFRVLPVAALINGSIFCVHGGLSSELRFVRDIPDARPCNVPHSGIICDLLWADPETDLPAGVDWAPSSRRISSVFSERALERFLVENDIDLVCRAHQVVEEGFQFFPDHKKRHLLTIFSATNYCNEFGNRGGILRVDEKGVCSIITLEPPDFVQQRDIMLFRDPLPNPLSHD